MKGCYIIARAAGGAVTFFFSSPAKPLKKDRRRLEHTDGKSLILLTLFLCFSRACVLETLNYAFPR